jgi:hypothetical protein
VEIKIGEYKNPDKQLDGDVLYIDDFVCLDCGLRYIFYGKGIKQFKKRLRAKGCSLIREGEGYCGKCSRKRYWEK